MFAYLKSVVLRFLNDDRFGKNSKRYVLLSLALILVSIVYFAVVSLRLNGTSEFSGYITHIGHYFNPDDRESKSIELTIEGESVEVFNISTLMYNNMNLNEFFERVHEGDFITVTYYNSLLYFIVGRNIHALESSSFSVNDKDLLTWHENVEKWTFIIISLLIALFAFIRLFQSYASINEVGKLNKKSLLKWQNITILLFNIVPVFIVFLIDDYDEMRLFELDSENKMTSKTIILFTVLFFAIINFILLFPLRAWSYESSKPFIQRVNKIAFIVIASPFIGMFFIMNAETFLNYRYKTEDITFIIGQITDIYEEEVGYEMLISSEQGDFTKAVPRSFYDSVSVGQDVLMRTQKGGWLDYYVVDNEMLILEE